MPRRLANVPLFQRLDDAAARPHAAHIIDRLRKYREFRGRHAMRRAAEILALRDQQLVVDPPFFGEEIIGVAIVSRYHHAFRTLDPLEVLLAPRIVFDNRHQSTIQTCNGLPMSTMSKSD